MSGAKSVAFMQKKSWHTGTMQHMEKVWLAEQKALEEAKKLEKVRKELAEEREIEDLRRQHEQATGKKRLERVDFLYQTPLSANDADEYLLGKKFQEDKKTTDIHTVASKPGSLYLNTPLDVLNDTRNKILEDPLFAIKQQEIKAKRSVLENPIKMKKLRDEVMMAKLKKEFGKKDKKKKRNREDDSAEERDSKRRRSRSRSRSPPRSSANRDGNGLADRDVKSEYGSGRGRRSRSRSRSPPRSSSSYRDVRRRSVSPPRRHRSRSPPRRNYDSYGRRSRSRSPPRRDYERRRSRSRSPPRRRSRSPRRDEKPSASSKSYSSSSSSRKTMTEEERARRLAEMEANAREHEQERLKLLKLAKENDEAEKEEEKSRVTKRDELAPVFLNDLSKTVYTDSKTGTLEDRVKRARFTSQRPTGTLDERGFL